jgi:hypothetical protein
MTDAIDRVIDPLSDYRLPVTVTDAVALTPVTTAVVSATFYSPDRTRLAVDVPCAYSGALGIYYVPILPEYSAMPGTGEAREGQYYADITVINAGLTRTVRAYYTVQFAAS